MGLVDSKQQAVVLRQSIVLVTGQLFCRLMSFPTEAHSTDRFTNRIRRTFVQACPLSLFDFLCRPAVDLES